MTADDAIGQIERLALLRESGAISEAEYVEMKDRIIATGSPVASSSAEHLAGDAEVFTPVTVPQVLTMSLSILLALGAALAVVAAIAYTSVGLADQALATEGQTIESISRILDRWGVADTIGGLWRMVFLVTALLFVVWTALSYRSAASRGADARMWGTGWAIGVWFIPVANLVLPKLVINEIDQMSSPELAAPIGERWKWQRRLPIAYWWWGTFAAAMIVAGYDTVMLRLSHRMFIPAGSYLLWAGAGILAAIVVARIGRRLAG